MDALTAYFQIDMAKEDLNKTTFMLNQGRYLIRKTVMGNLLSSNAWLKASDKVSSNWWTTCSLEDVTTPNWQRGWRPC